MMEARRMVTLEIGLAGIFGECEVRAGEGHCSRSGMWGTIADNYRDVVEGGYVLVKTAVLEHDAGLAWKSPMCDAKLAVGDVESFDSVAAASSVIGRAMLESGNGYGVALAVGVAAQEAGVKGPGPLDMVAPDVYAAWWLDRGAQVGRRVGDEIVWSDGTREAIEFGVRSWEGQRI